MALFENTLPYDLIKEFESIENNTKKIFGEMTQEAAKHVENNVRKNMKRAFKDSSEIGKHLSVSKVYTTADRSINSKVLFAGYMFNKSGKKVAVPLVVNAREFGTIMGERKKPFFRKAFKESEITAKMLKVQDKYIGQR